jgi:hypothetical protein
MRKTRKVNKKKSKTYFKKGGNKNKKNNINMTTLTTQMVGGQAAPAPAPRAAGAPPPASVNYNLDYASVVQSLQTFGETVWNLKEATAMGKEAAAERVLAAQADKTAVEALDTAAASLNNAFFGAGTGASRTRGLFETLLPATTFIPPTSASPAPR